MQHVVIGAGSAGIIAAEHLRKLNANATITKAAFSLIAQDYYVSLMVNLLRFFSQDRSSDPSHT